MSEKVTRRTMITRSARAAAAVVVAAKVETAFLAAEPLPRDPHEAVRLENDTLGVRLWGPPTQPTLSIGKADIWDRRWFDERQPLITAARIRELAFADRLSEVAHTPNRTVYTLYNRYDFPCPKPGVQLILLTPFGETATVARGEDGSVRLVVEGRGRRLTVTLAVALTRSLVFAELTSEGLTPSDLRVRVYRHRDTILPGQPLDPTLGDENSATDFDQLPAPKAWSEGATWGVLQEFSPDSTFAGGFHFLGAAAVAGCDVAIKRRDGERKLGTPLWAEKEGRISHGIVKRYTPINDALGAAATASFASIPRSFSLFATLCTTQDDPDVARAAESELATAANLGATGLRTERARDRRRSHRRPAARATLDGRTVAVAPASVTPSLRKPGGYYGDVPLCSVDSTKFCYQDAALWHADFHLNEVRAEGMLTLGQFEELRPYCEMIHTLLPQAQENARAVYGLPGAMYPLVHFPLRSHGVAHTNLTWEQDMGLNGLVAKPLWLWYRYTGDRRYLAEIAYPVLRECARFLTAYLTEEKDGRLHLVPSVSPEHWGLTARFERNRDCTSGLTLTRFLLRAAASGAATLRLDVAEAANWSAAASRLTAFPTHDSPDGPIWVDVAGAPPIEYNVPVPLSPVFWGDEVGLDSPAEVLAIAKRTLDQINVWVPHRPYLNGCVRPRLGIWIDGMSLGAENLLQSYQSLHIFPSVPPHGEIVMEALAAEGGFRVSAVRAADGSIHGVRLKSTVGGACRLANPWPGRAIEAASAGVVIMRTSPAATHISCPTRRGQTITVAPVGE